MSRGRPTRQLLLTALQGSGVRIETESAYVVGMQWGGGHRVLAAGLHLVHLQRMYAWVAGNALCPYHTGLHYLHLNLCPLYLYMEVAARVCAMVGLPVCIKCCCNSGQHSQTYI